MSNCEEHGHHYQQLDAPKVRPIFVFCVQCGQLLRFDLDQATAINPGDGLQPNASVTA